MNIPTVLLLASLLAALLAGFVSAWLVQRSWRG
jgi:hypothetical protein